MLRASAKAELAGVPSVSIISTGFLKQAEVVTKGLGLPNMAIAEFPGVPMTWSTDELRKQVVDKLLPRIIDGLTQAIAEQASTLLHTSNLFYHPLQGELAERLCAFSGMSRAFFCNSGAEAIDRGRHVD